MTTEIDYTMTKQHALAVLRSVQAIHGRLYKSKIRQAWETGNYRHENLTDWESQLQRIRNQFGPSWLVPARL